jgi:hypothetical protein
VTDPKLFGLVLNKRKKEKKRKEKKRKEKKKKMIFQRSFKIRLARS